MSDLIERLNILVGMADAGPWDEEGFAVVLCSADDLDEAGGGMILAGDGESIVAQCVMNRNRNAIIGLFNMVPEIRDRIAALEAEVEHWKATAAAEAEFFEGEKLVSERLRKAGDGLAGSIHEMLAIGPDHELSCSIGPIYNCTCDLHPARQGAREALTHWQEVSNG